MAYWNSPGYTITSINIGSSPNDGTGDDIRDAFLKVDDNLGNISTFLSGTSIDFLAANILTFQSTTANITNFYASNTVGSVANFTGNLHAANIIANTGLYSSGITVLTGNATMANVTIGNARLIGNTYTSAAIIPTANLQYDLGSPTNFFRNIYSQGLVQVNTTQLVASASLLELQTNVAVGSVQDVGILGKYNLSADPVTGNNWSYFGYQNSTGSFIYKSGLTSDASTGNSIVVGGVYGNVRFGSGLFSNTTPSTNTSTGAVVVAGGLGVAGNINAPIIYGNIVSTLANVTRMTVSGSVNGNLTVDGNLYAGGYQVVTTGTVGVGPQFAGGVINGLTSFINATQSTSTASGAVVVTGGVGVGGNLVASGLVGPYYGTVQTAAQPNITSVGTLTSLTVAGTGSINSVQATSVNTTNLLVTGTVSIPSLSGLSALSVNGNVTAANIQTTGVYATIISTTPTTGTSLTIDPDGSGSLLISNSTLTSFANTATSTSTTTGAVVVAGGLGVAGNINTGSLTTAGNINAGNVLATSFITPNTVINAEISTTGNISGGNLSVTNVIATRLTGTLQTAAQPNVTSVGTLTSLAVTGNVSANNAIIGNNVSATSVTATSITGTLQTAAQTSVTSVGTLTGLTVSGNTSVTNTLYAQGIYDNGNRVISISNGAGNLAITGNTIILSQTGPGATSVGSSTAIPTVTTDAYGRVVALTTSAVVAPAGTLTGGTLASGVTASSLTSVGTLTGLTVSGTVQPNANATVNLGTTSAYWGNVITKGMFVGSNGILPNANTSANIGSSTAWFNTFFGVSSQAQYADLAENYLTDVVYEPGTVVVVGGEKEVTACTAHGQDNVIGAVSTNPAYLMNGAAGGQPIALKGRIPLKVVGAITKGQRLSTSSTAGCAEFANGAHSFAIALETSVDLGVKIIEAIIL